MIFRNISIFTIISSSILVTLFLVSSASQAEQAAITIRDTGLFLEPSSNSEKITDLTKDRELLLLKRKGGWYQVRFSNQTEGWVSMLSVRFISVEEAQKNFISGLIDESAAVATASGTATGIRGATEGKLKASDYSPKVEMESLKRFVPTDEELQQFAREGELSGQGLVAPKSLDEGGQ